MSLMGTGRRHRLRTRSRSLYELDRRLEGDEIVLEHQIRRSDARFRQIDRSLDRIEARLELVFMTSAPNEGKDQ